MKKKKERIQLTEIFMAKAGIGNKGFDRCFHGTINRDFDDEGIPYVFGNIKVNDGYIIERASNQFELGEKLDLLLLLLLDYGLNNNVGKTSIVLGMPYFLN